MTRKRYRNRQEFVDMAKRRRDELENPLIANDYRNHIKDISLLDKIADST